MLGETHSVALGVALCVDPRGLSTQSYAKKHAQPLPIKLSLNPTTEGTLSKNSFPCLQRVGPDEPLGPTRVQRAGPDEPLGPYMCAENGPSEPCGPHKCANPSWTAGKGSLAASSPPIAETVCSKVIFSLSQKGM